MTAQALPPVLVVDDDTVIRDTLRTLLESDGYSVMDAATSVNALAYLRAATADHVVLLDFLMPGANGDTLLHAVKQDERLRRHAYLLLTAYPTARFLPDEQRLISELCLALVTKPFETDALLSAVSVAATRLVRK